MIEAKSLCKRYGSFAAVDDLSFTVETGPVRTEETQHLAGFNGKT